MKTAAQRCTELLKQESVQNVQQAEPAESSTRPGSCEQLEALLAAGANVLSAALPSCILLDISSVRMLSAAPQYCMGW